MQEMNKLYLRDFFKVDSEYHQAYLWCKKHNIDLPYNTRKTLKSRRAYNGYYVTAREVAIIIDKVKSNEYNQNRNRYVWSFSIYKLFLRLAKHFEMLGATFDLTMPDTSPIVKDRLILAKAFDNQKSTMLREAYYRAFGTRLPKHNNRWAGITLDEAKALQEVRNRLKTWNTIKGKEVDKLLIKAREILENENATNSNI